MLIPWRVVSKILIWTFKTFIMIFFHSQGCGLGFELIGYYDANAFVANNGALKSCHYRLLIFFEMFLKWPCEFFAVDSCWGIFDLI